MSAIIRGARGAGGRVHVHEDDLAPSERMTHDTINQTIRRAGGRGHLHEPWGPPIDRTGGRRVRVGRPEDPGAAARGTEGARINASIRAMARPAPVHSHPTTTAERLDALEARADRLLSASTEGSHR
ncbi:MAG: hypothetical protein KF809_14860 [Chloroflexi bacterium]|nr:hypothetical protein [Chloroflexota bacterium]